MSGFTPMQVTMKGLLKILNQAKDAGYVTVGGEGSSIPADGTKFQATQNADGSWSFVTDSAAVPSAPTTVSIPASKTPANVDGPGTSTDYVTLFNVAGVKWRIQAPPTSPGTEYTSTWFGGASQKNAPVTTGGAVEVTAVAESGYVLAGQSSWLLTFTNAQAATKLTIPTAAIPTAQDLPDMANDTVTLTKVANVTWTVDGVDHASNTFTGSTKVVPYFKGVSTVVTAKGSTSDYVVEGQSSWTLAFTNTPAATPTSGWTAVIPKVTLAGVADKTPAASEIFGGDGLTRGVKASKGNLAIASEAFVMNTGADTQWAALTGETYTRSRISWTHKAKLDAWERCLIFTHGSSVADASSMGIVGSAEHGFKLVEGPYLGNAQVVGKNANMFTVKVGDTITLEADAAAKKIIAYVNGAKVDERVLTEAGKNLDGYKNWMFYQGYYAVTGYVFDDVLVENYA